MDERPIPERPRAEPEIIPPGRPERRSSEGAARIWVAMNGRGTRRIYVARPGPLATILAALILGAVSVAFIVLLLGAVLIWLPVMGVIAAILILSSVVRGYLRGP